MYNIEVIEEITTHSIIAHTFSLSLTELPMVRKVIFCGHISSLPRFLKRTMASGTLF